MDKIFLSVVILTKNEADNIGPCLDSVRDWVDETVVVDDESSDQTVAIATARGAKILRRKMDNEGVHRNWAYAQARNPWVLSLDADERVSPGLREEMIRVLPAADCQAYSMPLKTYIGDYWVQHSGWYPARKLRLFQKDRFRYEEVEVHPRAFLDGKEGHLDQDIIHYGYPDLEHFLASVNRQSTLEAKKWTRTGVHMTGGRILRRTGDRFLRTYIRKKGFKDGMIGFVIALFAALYQVVSYAKYVEMKSKIKTP